MLSLPGRKGQRAQAFGLGGFFIGGATSTEFVQGAQCAKRKADVIKKFAKAALRPVWRRLRHRIEGIAAAQGARSASDAIAASKEYSDGLARSFEPQFSRAHKEAEDLRENFDRLETHTETINNFAHRSRDIVDGLKRSVYAPNPSAWPTDASEPFMAFANCQASDFYHPRFAALCKLMGARPYLHRKQWEWVYILHKLIEADVLKPGMRGLGFGVGTEPLPAVYASLGVKVTATDAPDDLDSSDAWHSSKQHSAAVEQLMQPHIVPDDVIRGLVTHQACDMNAIDPALRDYDFNWSSCCFEHLGNIELGLEFIVNAVEKTLKVGGIAVHTTELNMSSNDKTVDEGNTVLFRERDLRELIVRLRDRGHHVEDLVIGPPAHALDFHVDVPPFSHDVHLKLLLANYVCTSVGIVVRRGR